MIFRLISLLALFQFPFGAFSQSDSLSVLSFEGFMEIVRTFHPIANQANLQIEKGDAYLLKSKGGFDPILQGEASQKYFDGSKYYSILNGNLQIPTWFGIQLQSGYEITEGSRLNPQRYTPDDGLWYAGISVPLGKGLFIDQRRADLKQAKIYQQSTLIEQRRIINELLYEAGKSYFDWFKSFNKIKVYKEALTLAEVRFDQVANSVVFGDKPALDTIEAGIQVQTRKFQVEQALLEYNNSKELLSVYLWGENFIPLELSDKAIPPSREETTPIPFDNTYLVDLDSLKAQHPDILSYQYKIDFKRVDYRLNKENLKPKLDLKYNALSEPINGNPFNQYSINNYTWGTQLVFPIFVRKARGEVKLADIQLQEMENDIQFKTEFVEYKSKMAANSWRTTYEQILIFDRTLSDYQILVKGEQQLFDNGESSLFLVNYRETSYIDAQVKFIDALTENLKSRLTMGFVLGILK
jgi:outer membrane protein TolC